ncbi:hypothetical protein FRB93_004359 [Tulasnella sp. JGI-2019a]|nr:hypothetical protein FRB93_004359 [Tulasnella sp. JGI-2019a]
MAGSDIIIDDTNTTPVPLIVNVTLIVADYSALITIHDFENVIWSLNCYALPQIVSTRRSSPLKSDRLDLLDALRRVTQSSATDPATMDWTTTSIGDSQSSVSNDYMEGVTNTLNSSTTFESTSCSQLPMAVPTSNPDFLPVIPFDAVHRVNSICLDRILDFCTMREVTLFGQTSSSFRLEVRSYLLRRLASMLSPWIRDYTSMRHVMNESRSIISGSWALGFILGLADPVEWFAKDVDLYVTKGMPCQQLVAYLVTREGYTVAKQYKAWGRKKNPVLTEVEMYDRGIENVYKLTKVHNNGSEYTIDVIESARNSVIDPIILFDSTYVMNWIAHDSIVCLYPTLTLNKLGIDQSHAREGPRFQARELKYQERGFIRARNVNDLPDSPSCREACLCLFRSTYDVGVMVVSLITGGGDASHHIMPEARWRLRNGEGYAGCQRMGCPHGERMDEDSRASTLKKRNVNYKTHLRILLEDPLWRQ